MDGITLTVYGWDDMESCVKLTRKVDNGTFTYENNPSDLIYADKKRDWYLCALPGTTWGVTSKISKSENATSIGVKSDYRLKGHHIQPVDYRKFRRELQQ